MSSALNRHAFSDLVTLEISNAVRQQTALSLAVFELHCLRTKHSIPSTSESSSAPLQFVGLCQKATQYCSHLTRLREGEFALIMPGATFYDAVCVADSLSGDCGRLLDLGKNEDPFSVSVGVASLNDDDTASDLLLRAARLLDEARLIPRSPATIPQDIHNFH